MASLFSGEALEHFFWILFHHVLWAFLRCHWSDLQLVWQGGSQCFSRWNCESIWPSQVSQLHLAQGRMCTVYVSHIHVWKNLHLHNYTHKYTYTYMYTYAGSGQENDAENQLQCKSRHCVWFVIKERFYTEHTEMLVLIINIIILLWRQTWLIIK